MKRLFVAVASGQNVANLPPILEVAEPGDAVVWALSPLAAERQWADPASDVLRQAGLNVLDSSIPVTELNNPVELTSACRKWRGDQPATVCQASPMLVANGGPKLTPLGLLRGFSAQDTEIPPPTILYGNATPAELWRFESGLEQPPIIAPYQRHRLDLREILLVSRHELQNPKRARRIWPAEELPVDFRAERYGIDPVHTETLHRGYIYEAGGDPESDDGSPPKYAVAQRLLTDKQMARWRKSVGQRVRAMATWAWPSLRTEPSAADSPVDWLECGDEAIWSDLYSVHRNLIIDARQALERYHQTNPSQRLGDVIERTVARRLWHWLEANEGHAVQSVWTNVDVARADHSEIPAAEFDALLVLKSGVLLHIECKAATLSRKDLDARLLNLQRAASQLARMAIAGPLLAGFADEPWFAAQHKLRVTVEDMHGLPFLPLTLASQPADYQVGDAERWHCPTFEQALEKFLP